MNWDVFFMYHILCEAFRKKDKQENPWEGLSDKQIVEAVVVGGLIGIALIVWLWSLI